VVAVNPPLAAIAPEGLDSLLRDDLGSNLDLRTSDNLEDTQTRGDTPAGYVTSSTPQASATQEAAAWDECFAQMAAAND
jgi:hypothetical protein